MFLHYIAANDIINIYDWYIGIDISDRDLFVLNMSIAGISLFIILYLYVRSKISKALDLIADKDGNIDIENILTEMMENLMTDH